MNPSRLIRNSALLAFTASLWLTCPGVRAQDAEDNEEVVPAEQAAPAEQAEAPVAGVDAPNAPDELAKELPSMNFDRSMKGLLLATKSKSRTAKPGVVENFKMNVTLGDWKAIGAALATLPPDVARDGYSRLLSSLAEQSIPVGEVLKAQPANEEMQERMNRMNPERDGREKRPAPLLSEDLYSIIDAAPADLREDDIPAVTKLVRTALGEGGRANLVKRMRGGWKGLGGDSPDGRKLATRLLSSLGWIKDAAPFLPLKKEEWESADTTQLVFALEYFTRTGIDERDERQLRVAAELCALLMKSSRVGNYTRPQFRLAMDRLVQLLPALEREDAKKLIRDHLFTQSATLSDLITLFGELGLEVQQGQDLRARAASLGSQHLFLEALVAKEGELPANMAVLVMNWLTEAEACYRAGGVVPMEMSQAERMAMRRYGMDRSNKINSLSTAQILATAPPAELMPRLNAGLAQRVQLTILKVNILQPKETNLAMVRDYAENHPGLEREVCQDVLTGWVASRTKPSESAQVKQMRAYGMYVPPQMLQQNASGIPLTRLRQNQNIEQFKNLLAELRKISPEPLDPGLIVEAFMTLHSGAEVYRMADIEAIFGPPEKMDRTELLNLVGGMRGRLQEQWRDPKTQQRGGTNRTEEETKDEVSRGYRTAIELVRRGIREEDANWESFITRGQLFYDASQYEFDRQVKLADYVNLRDDAFASFHTAAKIYAAKLPDLPRGQWTIAPYQAWFFVMLGASDLAQLTTNTARTDPGLKSIGDAMRALPAEAAHQHLGLFATMLGELFPRVPANVRQRFLSAGLDITGRDHPAVAPAMASLDYYRELLDEIQLRVSVDGPTRVGHTQPFGMVISLEATSQLLRESGGFSKYLQNRANPMMGGGGNQSNLRDDFTRNIHAALDETFEVISLTYHDPAVKTINLPREGWVETPLLYAVLRAKSPAVDRIPSVQIDMDFLDQPGQVVLPILSQVLPIDAKDPTTTPRPVENLALTLTMDEREWKSGAMVVEISASGHGIIPNLDNLFATARPGFDLEAVDGNLSVSEFVSDGSKRLPKADRNWQLTYQRKPDLTGAITFPFPALKPGFDNATVEYKHYKDADLLTLDAQQAAAGVRLASPGRSGVRTVLLVIGAAVLAFAALLFLRRRKAPGSSADTSPGLPANLTPFTVVAFLHRLRQQRGNTLSPDQLAALNRQISELESRHFRDGNEAASSDLQPIVEKWSGTWHKRSTVGMA